jgi:RimJ/RimL family protein N-acetyltransferase
MVAAPIARRLRAERPWQEHERFYIDLFTDPGVMAAIWPGVSSREHAEADAVQLLVADVRHWQGRSFGPWVFFESRSGLFVGRGGLRATTLGGRSCVELLYAVRPDRWGRGYATEMSALALARARELGLTEVVALTTLSNRASRRVLEKSGMRFDADTVEHAGLAHWVGRWRAIV